MDILGKKGLSGIVKILLDLVFLGGIGIFISLPISVKWYIENTAEFEHEYYLFLLIFLYFTGVFGLMIVNEMRKIFISLNERSPFVMSTVKSLNRMAVSAFIIAIAYIVKVIFFNSFFTIIIAMIFIIAGFFSTILAEVFHQAVIVKEENDLTI